MTQRTCFGCRFNAQGIEFRVAQIHIGLVEDDIALAVNQHPGLAERYPDVIAAAVDGAARKGQQYAVCRQITGCVIACGGGQERRSVGQAFVADEEASAARA